MPPKASAPGKPPGAIHILTLGNGHFIKQSIAIIYYFEDVCDAFQSGQATNLSELEIEVGKLGGKSMRGATLQERARTREILGLADEATTYFSLACHKGSAIFALLERQHPTTSRFAMELCKKTLSLIETYYKDKRCENGVTIADCVLFSLLIFAKDFYSVDLIEGLPNLNRFVEELGRRESVKVGDVFYSEQMKLLASHFIEEKETAIGRLWQTTKLVGIYLWVLVRLVVKFLGGLFRKA